MLVSLVGNQTDDDNRKAYVGVASPAAAIHPPNAIRNAASQIGEVFLRLLPGINILEELSCSRRFTCSMQIWLI